MVPYRRTRALRNAFKAAAFALLEGRSIQLPRTGPFSPITIARPFRREELATRLNIFNVAFIIAPERSPVAFQRSSHATAASMTAIPGQLPLLPEVYYTFAMRAKRFFVPA